MTATTVAVALARDEADVVEGWVRHHFHEVDHIFIADNLSSDGTREILDALVAEGLPLTVIDDPDPAYLQSRKTSMLARMAADMFGPDDLYICPIDLDELWISRTDRLRVTLPALPWDVVQVPIYNHICTALDEPGDDPFATMVWRQRDAQHPLGKVAFRYQPDVVVHQGNHGVTLPYPGPLGVLTEPLLELRHFPVRSPDHMVKKARNGTAAYRAAHEADPDMPRDWGLHWQQWGAILETHGDEALRSAFRDHWWHLLPYLHGLVRDAAPYRRWELPPDTPTPA